MNDRRKFQPPWTAADRFPTEEAYQQWLKKQLKRYDDLRLVSLVLAAGCLLAGYVLNLRPLMILTILPLAATLLLTMVMGKIEAAIIKT